MFAAVAWPLAEIVDQNLVESEDASQQSRDFLVETGGKMLPQIGGENDTNFNDAQLRRLKWSISNVQWWCENSVLRVYEPLALAFKATAAELVDLDPKNLHMLQVISHAVLAFVAFLGTKTLTENCYTFTPDASEEVAFEATESPVVLGGRRALVYESCAVLACGCYASDQYSVGDFPVVLGRVTIQSSSINVAAVEIRAAESPAVQFVASGSRLYWRLPGDGAEYSIYRLRNGVLIRLATMQALDTAQFVSTSVNLEAITSPEIYVLLPSSQIIPSPSKMVLSGQQVTECDHVFPESETIGDITLVTMSGSNSNCWTDDRYSNSNYLVEKGLLGTMVAFRISPPTTIATQFVASRTNLYIRTVFAGGATGNPANDVKVWTYGHGQFELLDTVSKSDMDFAKTTVRLDNLEEELIVLIRPGTEQLTVWPQVSSTVEAAVLDGGDQWSLNCHRFQLDGQPFVPKLHWNHGPGTHSGNYGTYKRFFAVLRTDGREGVVWQDFTNDVVKVTWLAADLLSSETHQLTALNSQVLVGAAGDGANEMVLILGASEKPASKSGTVEAEAVKFSVTGSELLRKALPTEKEMGTTSTSCVAPISCPNTTSASGVTAVWLL
eukprot:g14139.t1